MCSQKYLPEEKSWKRATLNLRTCANSITNTNKYNTKINKKKKKNKALAGQTMAWESIWTIMVLEASIHKQTGKNVFFKRSTTVKNGHGKKDQVPGDRCQMICVTWHVSRFTCQISLMPKARATSPPPVKSPNLNGRKVCKDPNINFVRGAILDNFWVKILRPVLFHHL